LARAASNLRLQRRVDRSATEPRFEVKMARLALEQAEHPQIEKLAGKIIVAQEREVKIMEPLATKSGDHTMTGMNMG
jgi:DUF305 family protein family protein